MISQALHSQSEVIDVTRFPADRVRFVPKSELQYLSDLTYTIDTLGNLHYCARVIPLGKDVESEGDYDNRVTLARAELERYMNKNGFSFWLDRDTSVSGSHSSTGQSTDYLKKMPAAVLIGTFRRTSKNNSEEFAIPNTPNYRYQFTPESHRTTIEKYERLIGSKLREAKVSSKGYAIANANFLCPNPMLGIFAHNGINTTWQDFSAMLVTNSAAVAEENPDYAIFTRASLIKDELKGVPTSTTAMEWYGLSCQMKVKEFKSIQSAGSLEEREKQQKVIRALIRAKQTVNRERLPNGQLEPFREGMVKVTKLQDPDLEERRQLNNPINASPPNRESGYALHQIIAAGEECGMLGDPQVLHSHLQLNRLYEMALEEIERYGEDLTLTAKQKEDSEDSQIDFATMTISKTDGTPAFTGRSVSATKRITWQMNSPSTQLSRFWREQQTYYLPDGSPILLYPDPKTGKLMYREPYAASEVHATRDTYGIAAAIGITSRGAYSAKCICSEGANDMEMTPQMVTALHKIRYANYMGKDFKRAGYWMCSVFADIQSLGFDIPGLKRLLIFHTGFNPEVRKGKKSAPLVYRGYAETHTSSGQPLKKILNIKDTIDLKFKHLHETLKATMRAPIVRLTGFDGREFTLRANKDGMFPWFDDRSPFYLFMEARFLDQREASKPKWVHPLVYQPGEEQYGYLRFMQYGGIDLELPLHCYLQLFCAGVVNLYEEIHKEVEKHVPAHLRHKLEIDIHQTDGTREWHSFYEFMRLPDIVLEHLSEASVNFFESFAQEALVNSGSKRIISSLQTSDLKVEFNSDVAFEIFRGGKEKQTEMDAYFEAVKNAYKSRLAREGYTSEEIQNIVANIQRNKIGYFKELHSISMKGDNPDPLITRTYNSAITFLIGISARVKIKWPDNKEFPDSDDEAQLKQSKIFKSKPKHTFASIENDLRILQSETSELDDSIKSFLSTTSDAVYSSICSTISNASLGRIRPVSFQDLKELFKNQKECLDTITKDNGLIGTELSQRIACPPDVKGRIELWLADGADATTYSGSLSEDCMQYLLSCLIADKNPGDHLPILLKNGSAPSSEGTSSDLLKYLSRLMSEGKEQYAPDKARKILLNSLVENWINKQYPSFFPNSGQIQKIEELFQRQLTRLDTSIRTY